MAWPRLFRRFSRRARRGAEPANPVEFSLETALLAGYIPARRAARVDPLLAVRDE